METYTFEDSKTFKKRIDDGEQIIFESAENIMECDFRKDRYRVCFNGTFVHLSATYKAFEKCVCELTHKHTLIETVSNKEDVITSDEGHDIPTQKLDISMNQKEQINHWLNVFTQKANEFWEANEMETFNYWKGQVMGISKMITVLNIDIDTTYHLKQLP